MDIKTQLKLAMQEALKAGDPVRLRTLRMVNAAIHQIEVDKQTTLDEAAILSLLQKEIKNRHEALEEARRANRPDLIAENEAEIRVLQSFLPQALSPDELRALAQAAVAESGASSLAEMGKVMKILMPRLAGRASGDQASAVVRELLTKQTGR